ncbi:MAG: cell filamentation protein Fic [Spirochaetae bacterium HGW-Spirochaetae-5]|nr:MAG: cell filamentation protein Fic [Spirochaetae bacterium HGW-Spirochaetae-5]
MDRIKDLLLKIDELQKQIDDQRPLSRESVISLREYYKIGLTWSSNAMEGNTLTESETKVVIEDGLTIGGKPLRDHLEAQGHADAFEYMLDLAVKKEISEEDILMLHRLFYRKIDDINAGVYRKSQVFISGSKYPLPGPDKVPQMMKDFVKKTSDFRASEHPVIAAAKAHLEFVFIHPFVDGNGRVARLIMNLILIQGGCNVALISPVLRPEYISSIEAAHKDDGGFLNLVCRSVYETQKDYLRMLNI